MTQKNYHKKFLLNPAPTQVNPSDTVLELGGRYAGLTSSAAARAKTLQVKCKVVNVIFTLFEEGLCLL